MHHKKWLHLPDTLKGRQINCCSTQWCIFLLFFRENLGFLECLRVAKILNFYCSAAHVHVGLSVFQLSLICTSIILSRDQYEETDHTCFIYANTCKYMGLEINCFCIELNAATSPLYIQVTLDGLDIRSFEFLVYRSKMTG